MLKNAEEKVSPDGRTEMQEARKKKKKGKENGKYVGNVYEY